jgi:hypothetical protein
VYAFKRSFALGLLALLLAVPAFPQEGGAPAKGDNLYSAALFASIVEMEKSCGYIDDSIGGSRVRTDYRHTLVEKDPEITDRLPSQLGDYRVEYLDKRAQIDRYKKLRKAFPILRIHPMQNEGARLELEVSVSYLTHQKRRWLYGVSDWSDVEFQYDCGKQKFVVSAVKLGGI